MRDSVFSSAPHSSPVAAGCLRPIRVLGSDLSGLVFENMGAYIVFRCRFSLFVRAFLHSIASVHSPTPAAPPPPNAHPPQNNKPIQSPVLPSSSTTTTTTTNPLPSITSWFDHVTSARRRAPPCREYTAISAAALQCNPRSPHHIWIVPGSYMGPVCPLL